MALASGVRDLFGSMPVRVKQRAIEADRSSTKEWDQLVGTSWLCSSLGLLI